MAEYAVTLARSARKELESLDSVIIQRIMFIGIVTLLTFIGAGARDEGTEVMPTIIHIPG